MTAGQGSAKEADQGPRDSCGGGSSWELEEQMAFLEVKSRGPSLKAKNKSGFWMDSGFHTGPGHLFIVSAVRKVDRAG